MTVNTSQTVLSMAVRNTTGAMRAIFEAVTAAGNDAAGAERSLRDAVALSKDLTRNLEFAVIELAMAAKREADEAVLKGQASVILGELVRGQRKAAS